MLSPAGKVFGRAKHYFGTTLDPDKAGYILPDGTMLDFSGEKGLPLPEHRIAPLLGATGDRELDHREINFAFADDELDQLLTLSPLPSSYVGMWRFMNLGAIRFSNFGGTVVINLVKTPTIKQVETIIRALQKYPDSVLVIEIDYPNLGQITYRDFTYPFTGWRAFVNKTPVLVPSTVKVRSDRVLTLREIAAQVRRR